MSKIAVHSLYLGGNLNRTVLIHWPAMPRPRARLDYAAVAAAFAPDGLHGVSAGEVARRAGIAKPTLYAHGRSKDAAFLACVEAEVERLLDRLYEAQEEAGGLTPRQRIAALAQAVLEHGREHPEAARLLHVTARHSSSTVAADVDAALARVPARIAAALRHDAGPERASQIGTALLGATAALAFDRHADPPGTAQLLGDAFASVLDGAATSGDAAEHVRSVDVY